MAAVFAWPASEVEHLDHLHRQHGVMVGSLTEWRALFGNMRHPSDAHAQMHQLAHQPRAPHRHTTWGRPA